MATTYPNMNLASWNLLTDTFSHTQLDTNWSRIDAHNHVPIGSGGTGGVPVPEGGLATNSIATAKIQTSAVTESKLAADSVSTSKIVDSNVTDLKLQSPNNGIYRTLHQVSSGFTNANATGAAIYGLGQGGHVRDATSTTGVLSTVFIDPAELTVNHKTAYLNIRANVYINNVGPGNTLTFGLHNLSGITGVTNGQITYGFAAAVASSTIVFSNMSTNTRYSDVSANFVVPTSGHYAIGVALSQAPLANSLTIVSAALRSAHL